METYTVAKKDEISELNPFVVEVGSVTLGIYKFNDRYYAYANECAHEGGPAVEGLTIGTIETELSPEGKRLGDAFSKTKMDIVCPWHGVQYDLVTGICRGDKSLKLTSYEVYVEDDVVKVRI